MIRKGRVCGNEQSLMETRRTRKEQTGGIVCSYFHNPHLHSNVANKIYSKLSAVLFTCLVNFIFSLQFSKLAVNNSVNNALNFQTKPVLALANQVKALIKTCSGPVKETKVGLIETPISRL